MIWVAALVALLWSPDGPGAHFPNRDAERVLAAAVEPARAQQRVRELVALGPRMGGTRSGDAAADYVARRFRELGLDVRIVDDPEKDTWQPLRWTVRAHRLGPAPETRTLDRAWPLGFSPDASGRAELSLQSHDGGAWLADRWSSVAAGAAVVLLDGQTTLDGRYPVVHHLREAPNVPWFGLSKDEGRLLRSWLASEGRVEIEFELRGEARRAGPKTVLARLPSERASGPAWKADYFLFCAHGDSDAGGPGADDNASGVATLLEIAAAWKQAIDTRRAPPPARELRFAVWGSEIFSTSEYLKRAVPGEGELLGVVNYDQAGFGSGADQLNIEPDDREGNLGLVRALTGVLADHAPPIAGEPGDFPSRWATNRSLGGTDSYCFSDSAYFKAGKRPAVTLFTSAWGRPAEHPKTPGMPGESWSHRDVVAVDYDVHYHSAGDTPENTTDREPWNMAWCARVGMLGVARYLAGLP